MRTPEHERLDIRRELREIVMEESIDLLSRHDPSFDEWDKSWCSYFFDDHAIIEYMYAFAVHPSTHGGFCSEDSYLPIPTLYDCLCSWYCHSEDMLPDKYFSLHPPQCMDTRSIACEDDYICSASPESLDSRLRELSDVISRL